MPNACALFVAVVTAACISGTAGTTWKQELQVTGFPEKFFLTYYGDMDNERAGTFDVMTVPLNSDNPSRMKSGLVLINEGSVILRDPWSYTFSTPTIQFRLPPGAPVNMSGNPDESPATAWPYGINTFVKFRVKNPTGWPVTVTPSNQSSAIEAVDLSAYSAQMADSTDKLMIPPNHESTFFKFKRHGVIFETSLMNQKYKLPWQSMNKDDNLAIEFSNNHGVKCKSVASC